MQKLSPAQMKVLKLMAEGWELGLSSGLNFYAWLQKNGLGCGGPTERVHAGTFNGLCRRGLVRQVRYGFLSSLYGLTDDGKKIARPDDTE